MKLIATTAVALIATTTFTQAQSKTTELCGAGHANELQQQSDIQSNPDGYFVRGLNTQLSNGDPQIIQAVGDVFHLCTRSAATPNMRWVVRGFLGSKPNAEVFPLPLRH